MSDASAILPILTEHLRLIPCDATLARSANLNASAVETLLGASAAPGWPEEAIRDFLPLYARLLDEDPALLGWGIWIIVHQQARQVIGDIGFKGKPDAEGSIELGYSIVPAFRRQGYATEAARALLVWAFSRGGVVRVMAECDQDNYASAGVLRKLGMMPIGIEDGLLRWEIVHPASPASSR